MPKVPLRADQVADPFANTAPLQKNQERLPQGMGHSPLAAQPYPLAEARRPSMAEILMSAATMHQMGKFSPKAGE